MRRIGVIVSVLGMGGFLLASLGYAIYAWLSINTTITWHGYLAMLLGAGFTALVAGGLVFLMYYSRRHGYDDEAGWADDDDDR